MAEVSVLDKVKAMIGVTGTYQDAAIQGYIDEVKQYLLDGGVSSDIVDASTSAGIIARGVTDLWNYGAGEGQLSQYFKERAIQLASKSKSGDSGEEPETITGVANLIVTVQTTDMLNCTADKTYAEIDEAFKSGKSLLMVFQYVLEGSIVSSQLFQLDSIPFSGLEVYSFARQNGLSTQTVSVNSDDSIQLVTSRQMASAWEIGGVSASNKTDDYTVEVKIDRTTGKLYVPSYPTA